MKNQRENTKGVNLSNPEFVWACKHFSSKTKPGTFVHLIVKGRRTFVEYNKTEKENNFARFFSKNVVPMTKGGKVSVHISIDSEGTPELLFPLEAKNETK